MTDRNTSPRGPAKTGSVLVTAASGVVGSAVVEALVAAGESVVAGMRDPRAWLAEGARRASGTPAGLQPDGPARPGSLAAGSAGPATVRPGGKPLRAPNQKPSRAPTGKPGTAPGSAVSRPAGRAAPTATGPGAHTPGPVSSARGASGATTDGAGVSVRAFDFADRGTWARSLAGADRVFLVVPPTISDVGRTIIPFIDQAMEQAGVRQIVLLSAPGARLDTRSPHHLVEQYLKRTRCPHTILRPNVLMQTLSTRYRDDVRLRGELALPAAAARVAFVDATDVARVAARVLASSGHLRKTYSLAGEQALSYAEVARILTEALGRPVHYTAVSEAEYLRLATEQGATAAESSAQVLCFRAVRRRLTAFPSRTVRRLTGRPATTVSEFVAEHRHTWR